MSDTPETKKQLSQVEGLFRLAAEANGFAEFARSLECQRNMLLGTLKKCALVLSGETMTKGRLIEALESARDAIKAVNQSKQ